ncbi:hypothetical protein [Rhizobium arsenicireducens]
MEYIEEVIDRKTGELVTISKGDWVTITELGELHGIGPRKLRAVLRQLGFLQLEYGGNIQRHRLAPWITQRGWGKRLKRSVKGRHQPFDVVGPDARAWIEQRLPTALAQLELEVSDQASLARSALDDFKAERNSYRARLGSCEMSVQEMVSWLADHWPDLSQSEVALVLDVSQQLVSRFLGLRTKQLQEAKARREARPGISTGEAIEIEPVVNA